MKILHTKPEGYTTKSSNDEFEHGIDSHVSSEPLECEIKVSLQPLRINIDQVRENRGFTRIMPSLSLGYTGVYETIFRLADKHHDHSRNIGPDSR